MQCPRCKGPTDERQILTYDGACEDCYASFYLPSAPVFPVGKHEPGTPVLPEDPGAAVRRGRGVRIRRGNGKGRRNQ